MISEFFIERPIFANVIAIVTIILGLVCFYILPVSQYPPIVPPTIQVSTRYPGASAEVVAATVGIPIEQAINGVEGAIYMSSTSASDGSYTLTVTFNVGTDLNTALALVQNYVNSALAQLPAGAANQGITVRKVSTDIVLVVSIASKGDRYDATYLSNYAVINLENPLARLPGVGQVIVKGRRPLQYAGLAGPPETPGLQFDDVGRRDRHPGPERAGGGRADGRSAGAAESSLPIHRQRPGPPGRRIAIRKHHHQEPPGGRSGPNRAHQGRRPGRAEPTDLQQFCRGQRPSRPQTSPYFFCPGPML